MYVTKIGRFSDRHDVPVMAITIYLVVNEIKFRRVEVSEW